MGSRITLSLISLLLLLGSLKPVAGSETRLPEIGDPSGNIMTPAQEQRLGKAFMRNVRKTMVLVQDPLTEAYIQSLGERLLNSAEDAKGSFNFFLVDDKGVNAFAGPGGHIGVYTGLITTTESESELASVLAHEIAHVTQQHLVRTFDAVNRMSLPAAALAITALVIGAATNNPDAAVAATTGIQAGMLQRQINFTRSHEEEADRIGIRTLASAGFDPAAMPVFFGRMGKASRLYDRGKLPEFLRTHPVTSNRIADAYSRSERYPYRQHPDSLEYHLLRARLRVAEFKEPQEALQFFGKTLREKRYRNEEGQRFGYLLALTAARQFEEAEKQARLLLSKRPEQIDYIVADALLQVRMGRADSGIERLRNALDIHPGNYALSIYLAQSLLDIGRAAEAGQLLERQLAGRSEDASLYRLLARAAGDSGNKTQGHYFLAEHYYLNGNLDASIQQFEIALRDRTLAFYDNARITARLKEVQQEKQELRSRQR